MNVLCDACPVIFLGKINQLNLIFELFPGEIIVPRIIKSEICTPLLPPAEEKATTTFLNKCSIITIDKATFSSQSLSYADNCILTYALSGKIDILLSDDKLVRRVALNEKITPVGTLGVLIRAMKKAILSPDKVRELIHELIHEHSFRISIEVFEAVLKIIDGF